MKTKKKQIHTRGASSSEKKRFMLWHKFELSLGQ